MKSKKKRSFRDFLSVALAILSLSLLFYPIVANYLVSNEAAVVVSKFNDTTSSLSDAEIASQLASAKAYNNYLYEMNQKLPVSQTPPAYNKALSVDSSGMMGDVTIPQINVTHIPIYHGDSQETLSLGVGHIAQTSLPIGGENTHTVLSAHSGRANNTLFTHLDLLKKGDVFYLHTLNSTLKYKIDTIKIVQPDDASSLGIHPGKDEATLVTCYPTGINSQRLLVTGERIPYTQHTQSEQIKRYSYGYDFWVIVGTTIFILALILAFFLRRRRKKKEKANALAKERAQTDQLIEAEAEETKD